MANPLPRALAGALLAVGGLGSCAHPVAAPTNALRAASRLVEKDGALYAVGPNLGALRCAYLYVLESTPSVPGSQERRTLGVIRGVNGRGDTLEARWTCRPRQPTLPPEGLPVEVLNPLHKLYSGPCWGRYLPAQKAPSPGPSLVLTLDRGESDGVHLEDRYEVLRLAGGDPNSEQGCQNFQVAGVCHVEHLDEYQARCRLDRELAPTFDEAAWMNGGFVRRIEPTDSATPPATGGKS